MEQLIRHIHFGCSWTTQSPVVLEDFKPNSHWLQLIITNRRTGHWHLPKKWLLHAWPWNCPRCADLSHQRKRLYLIPSGVQSRLLPTATDIRFYGGHSKSQKPVVGSLKLKWSWDQSPGHTRFVGSSHRAQEIPVTDVICLHAVFSVIPVLQPFTYVLNFTPAKLPAAGIKKPWDALQNDTSGAQWFCFVTVSISVLSHFPPPT